MQAPFYIQLHNFLEMGPVGVTREHREVMA